MKTVFRIRFNKFEIRDKWMNELIFYETLRNGILCHIPMIRINLMEKNIFYNCVKLFNKLPLNVRQKTKFNEYVNLLKTNI